jgi:hypothetical protein
MKGRKKICYRQVVGLTPLPRQLFCHPFRAVRFFCPYLGLKPQAESYYPFRIGATAPPKTSTHPSGPRDHEASYPDNHYADRPRDNLTARCETFGRNSYGHYRHCAQVHDPEDEEDRH